MKNMNQTTTTNNTNKEDNKMRFELNGTIYESNEKGNYFYKSTGKTDKKGNPVMMRISQKVWNEAWDKSGEAEKQARENKQAKSDKMAEQAMNIPKSALKANKKYVAKQNKPRRSKDIAHESNGVTLTAKQVDFIKRLPESNFYEDGLDSTLWIDCLADDLGGQFAGKSMTIGAMVSTLREKGIIEVARDVSREGKPKFMTFTKLGKQIAKEMGLA